MRDGARVAARADHARFGRAQSAEYKQMLTLGFIAGGLALVGTLRLLQLGPNPLGLVHFLPSIMVMVFNKLFDLRLYFVVTVLAGAIVIVQIVNGLNRAVNPV